MLERERQTLILKLVQERSIVSVPELAELLPSSESTVRRDINFLAERGELRRIRGGVEARHPRPQAHLTRRPFAIRQTPRAPEKRAIARAAAALISSAESIIIHGGTTTFCLVEFLADRNLDILTNSLAIASSLLAHSHHRVTISGGTLCGEQDMILTSLGNGAIDHFCGQKLLTGCFGINQRDDGNRFCSGPGPGETTPAG